MIDHKAIEIGMKFRFRVRLIYFSLSLTSNRHIQVLWKDQLLLSVSFVYPHHQKHSFCTFSIQFSVHSKENTIRTIVILARNIYENISRRAWTKRHVNNTDNDETESLRVTWLRVIPFHIHHIQQYNNKTMKTMKTIRLHFTMLSFMQMKCKPHFISSNFFFWINREQNYFNIWEEENS